MSYFKLNTQTFTSNGTWVAPAGCAFVILTGYGGGGGGGGGKSGSTTGGGGGGGSQASTVMVAVTPGTSYSITIGAGGTGGGIGAAGNDGGATSFGSLATFVGASKGYGDYTQPRYNAAGGNVPGKYTLYYGADLLATIDSGSGGNTLQSGITPPHNFVEFGSAFTVASNGTTGGSNQGGGGGGTGPGGAGGNGGNGSNGGTGGTGSNAGANTGAGGGGGGAGTTGGSGGNGGSGQLVVAWIS